MERCKKHMDSWRVYVSKTTATNFQVNDIPRYVTFTHPGLDFSYFDRRTGNPDMARLLQLVEDVIDCGTLITYQEHGLIKTLMNYEQMIQGNEVSILGLKMSMCRTVYNPTVLKWPVNAKVSFGGFGKTTFTLGGELSTAQNNEPIITLVGKYILMDAKTPVSVPDWMKENLQGKENKLDLPRMDRFSKPVKTFVHRLKIMWSDANWSHTKFTSYVRFGLDTLHLAILRRAQTLRLNSWSKQACDGKRKREFNNVDLADSSLRDTSCPVKWIDDNVIKRGLKSVTISYLKESFEGNEMNVQVWQKEDEHLTVRCSVESTDNTHVFCQIYYEYFGPVHHL